MTEFEYLEIGDVVHLHRRLIDEFGGSHGVRDQGALESALAQPRMTFGGQDLYHSMTEKATALGFSLIKNHPFVDGNKRIGHAAIATFLKLNGYLMHGDVTEQENTILAVAAGVMHREEFAEWVHRHVK